MVNSKNSRYSLLSPYVVIIIVGTILLILGINAMSPLNIISISIGAALFGFLLIDIIRHGGRLKLWLRTNITLYNKDLRISVAYIFRIMIDQKCLLVSSDRRKMWQPIGGAYKFLPEAKGFKEKICFKKDIRHPTDIVSVNDIRGIIKAQKLLKFIKWFESQREREFDPWRELIEEITSVCPSISKEQLRNGRYRNMGRIMEGPHFDHQINLYQFRIFDIFQYNDIPEEICNTILSYCSSDMDDKDRKIILTEEALIRLDGAHRGKLLGPHTKYIQ